MGKISDRLVIIGVVHGQRACIEEARSAIERERPEAVAIELPPQGISDKFNDIDGTIDDEINRITKQYGQFFDVLKQAGMPHGPARRLEEVALGLAMQGFEFQGAIEAARKIGARIEFIDIARDKLFWEFIKETFENLLHAKMGGASMEKLHNMLVPSAFPNFFKAISDFFSGIAGDWEKSFHSLIKIYSQPDYMKLAKEIVPLMRDIEKSPVLNDVLVHHRNRFMADQLLMLLKETTGKIVVITGFGHVEGLISLVDEKNTNAS